MVDTNCIDCTVERQNELHFFHPNEQNLRSETNRFCTIARSNGSLYSMSCRCSNKQVFMAVYFKQLRVLTGGNSQTGVGVDFGSVCPRVDGV